MKIIAIHQPQYLPYLGFFNKLASCDIFVALEHVKYDTGGMQNRNRIKTGSNGNMQWLTVPICHGGGDQPIREVKIDSSPRWRKKHWNLLNANYYRARYFQRYAQQLRALINAEYKSLSELNMTLIAWCMEELEIGTPIVYSSALNIGSEKTAMLVEICKSIGADSYLSGPGGANYMDLPLFEKAGIQVLRQNYKCPRYEQQFPAAGFLPNLSIIDALLNCGPQTARLLHELGSTIIGESD